MSGDGPSPIATTLAEKLATDGDWDQAKVDASHEFDLLIHVQPGQMGAARDHVEGVGGTVENSYGDVLFARARADRVVNLANGAPIRKVEERADPMGHTTSEGVGTTNADQLHSLGLDGDGVTVAVIDQQFNPDQSEISDQVIDQIGNSDNFRPGVSGLHGTACAEIVAEMVPQADLVLASALGISFITLMNDITSAHEPEVMSMSLGYKPTLRLDGQDAISSRIVDYTSASGTNTTEGGIFAVSAGNEADGDHWDGQWQDSGSGYMDFGGGNEFFEITTTASGQEIVVQTDVNWSEDQDYSLELYDSTTSSTPISDPTPTTTPAQDISVPGSDGSTTTSYLKIKDEGLDGTEHFDIFTWGRDVNFPVSTSERSIGIPATSPDTLTLSTGAVRHDTDELEAFSSRGPTQDGRRGVDVVAPDGTLSDTYGAEFFGTSAACPHVGGAAALLMAFSEVNNEHVQESLTATARGVSDPTLSRPNSLVGHGYVELDGGLDDLVGLVRKANFTLNNGRAQYAQPAVDSDGVYAGGLGQGVVSYTRADALSWNRARLGELSDSSPTVVNGTVYVGSGAGRLYAIDATDGSVSWTHPVGSAVTSSPAIASGTVFAAANDGTVFARNASDGSAVWTTSVGGPVYSTLAASGGLVYLTTNDGVLVCLDASNGNEQWRFDTGADLGASSPTVANGSVFLGADAVYAFDDASSRTKQWETSYGGTAGSSPAYAGGSVYVGSADGSLYAMDATSGSVSWSKSTGGAIAASPVATPDRVIVPSLDGNLYVYLADGTEVGNTALPSETRSSPTLDDNDVYLGTRSSELVRH